MICWFTVTRMKSICWWSMHPTWRRIISWIVDHNENGAVVENASDGYPNWLSRVPMQRHCYRNLQKLISQQFPYYHFMTGELAGVDEVIISNSGYTGAGGFELYMYNEDGPQIWEKIFEAGKEMGLEPAGLGSQGYPEAGDGILPLWK